MTADHCTRWLHTYCMAGGPILIAIAVVLYEFACRRHPHPTAISASFSGLQNDDAEDGHRDEDELDGERAKVSSADAGIVGDSRRKRRQVR